MKVVLYLSRHNETIIFIVEFISVHDKTGTELRQRTIFPVNNNKQLDFANIILRILYYFILLWFEFTYDNTV